MIRKLALNKCRSSVKLPEEHNYTIKAMVHSRYGSPMLQELITYREKMCHGDMQPVIRSLIEYSFNGEVAYEDSSIFKLDRLDLRKGLRPDLVFRYRNGRRAVWEFANHIALCTQTVKHYIKKLNDPKVEKLHVCAMAWGKPSFELVKKHGGRFFTLRRDEQDYVELIEVM